MEQQLEQAMLTANELARRWGVSVYTIHRLANQRDGLPAYKVGSLTRFKPAEAEAYLAAHQIKAPEEPRSFPCQRFTYTPGMKVVRL